jgi:ATP-binding cassette subfamily F protein 3
MYLFYLFLICLKTIEQARVALANFVLVPHNLLILDEPSNHLDMATVHVLTEALQASETSVCSY